MKRNEQLRGREVARGVTVLTILQANQEKEYGGVDDFERDERLASSDSPRCRLL